jgi:hypothetical protein
VRRPLIGYLCELTANIHWLLLNRFRGNLPSSRALNEKLTMS